MKVCGCVNEGTDSVVKSSELPGWLERCCVSSSCITVFVNVNDAQC